MKKIGVIGAGYVGLVSAAGISDIGHKVICADINKEKIENIKRGKMPIYEPGLKELVDRNVKSNRLLFSNRIKETIKKSDIIFIAVGTPEGICLLYTSDAADE